MPEHFQTDRRELDELFERYRVAPGGHVFAPLADACRKAGMLEEALEICAKGVAAQPRYASGWVVQGKCLYDAGRPSDAEASFRRVLDLDPKNLVALKYLGIIHAERGDTTRARGFFEHILALDPGDREIRGRIRGVQEPGPEARRYRPSRPLYDAVSSDDAMEIRDVPDEDFEGEPITLRDETVTPDEIATMTLADIYASQGYASKALKIYREVLRRQPGHPGLARKIDELERAEAHPVESAPADESAPARAPEAPRPRPDPPATAPAAAPRVVAGSLPGAPIDESRSYEQFKRWLKTVSD